MNKRRLIIVVCCFLLLPFISDAQTFFQTYTGANLGGTAMIKSPDGNYFVGGKKSDSAMVMKIDPDGNTIWTVSFNPTNSGNNFYVISMEITPDNFLIGTGESLVPGLLYPDEAFYFKMDLNGNVQYCKEITGVGHDFTTHKMLPLSSSSYIIVAAHEPFSGNYSDPMIIKINGTTGSVTSQSPRYDYQNNYIDDISESILSPDKRFIYSTGRLYVSGAGPDQMRVFIAKFDTMGNNLWTNYYVFPSSSAARMYGDCLIYDDDSLVIGYVGDNIGTSPNFEMGIIKVDTTGNMAWSKHFDIPSSTYERPFRILRTNYGYAMVGFETGITEDMMMIGTDINGNELWCKSYGSITLDDYLPSIFGALPAVISNNSIYFTGVQIVAGNITNLIIGKTDSAGNSSCVTSADLVIVQTDNPVFTGTRIISSVSEPVSFVDVTGFQYPIIPIPCSNDSLSLGADTFLCTGSLILDATTAGATQYTWQDGSSDSTLQVSAPGTYSVEVLLNCCILRDTIQVIVGQPSSSVFDLAICFGDSLVVGTSVYSQPGIYTDTLLSAAGCDSIVTITLQVDSLPVVGAQNSDSICIGQQVILNATGAQNYFWSPSTELSCTNCQSPTASPIVTTIYFVVGVDSNGCSAYDSLTIIVGSAVIDAGNDTLIVAGQCVVLNGTGAQSYVWSPSTYLNDSSIANPTACPDQDITYYLTGITAEGCIATDSVTIRVISACDGVFIPDAFTPNGDGVNDEFGIITFGGITLNSFRVFSRWGELIFQTNDLNKKWAGDFKELLCPLGVYVYVADIDCGEKKLIKGNVTLLR
ncbi:MAG TPA: gliding motility-associated C-terminal domain-containing protein [Chitinophagales bacterium]|nr:gliding motility-associated C-terminal domain-containing protein [Chitinophagales bacterium]